VRHHLIWLIIDVIVALFNIACAFGGLAGNASWPAGVASAALCILLACGQINSIRELEKETYYRRVMEIAQRRSAWAGDVARRELDIYGETYDHDRSYIPGYGERS
jgi:uncharacterized membrane protein YtjA (UPF0391 family)